MSVIKCESVRLETSSRLTAEIAAFQKSTAALEEAQADATRVQSHEPLIATQQHTRLCQAVYQNTRLWLTLLEDLINSANSLAHELKARLGSLAAVSVRHGQRVVAGRATVALLIDINRAVAAGLIQARATGAAPMRGMPASVRPAGLPAARRRVPISISPGSSPQ